MCSPSIAPISSTSTRTALRDWSETKARAALSTYASMIAAESRRLRAAASRTQSLDIDDLVAEGQVAVLEALGSFQGWGVAESTWVRTRIRQRMVDAIRRQSLWSREDARAVARASNGESRDEEDRTRAAVVSSRRLVAIDGGDESTERRRLASILPAANAPADDLLDASRGETRLKTAMNELPARTRLVVERVLFQGVPNSQVAEELGVSNSRVSQLLHGAVERLREVVAEPQTFAAVA